MLRSLCRPCASDCWCYIAPVFAAQASKNTVSMEESEMDMSRTWLGHLTASSRQPNEMHVDAATRTQPTTSIANVSCHATSTQ